MTDPSPEEEAAGDRAVVGFEGRLEGLSLSEVLWRICREGRTGVLRVRRGSVEREVSIRDGRVVFLTSNDPNDRLGERLLRQRKITLEQLQLALAGLRSGKRLGRLLSEAGAIAAEEIAPAVLCQLRAVLLDLLAWRRGEYEFRAGVERPDEEITLDTSAAALLFHGLRNLSSVEQVQQAIGPPCTRYALLPAGSGTLRELQLTEGEKLVLERLDAGPATLRDLCRELLVAGWEVCQAIYAFLLLGIVEQVPGVAEDEQDSGRLEERSVPELLVALHGARRSGMLRLQRDGVTRRLYVENGRCVFAASSASDDSLVSRLFRDGMISLADLEEANRRIASGRRPGSILRELGVLDDADVREAVQRQVGEIVLDSFGWTDGLWAFRAGPLPMAEEIPLDRTTPALIAEGVRRIGSWTRLVRGCGGIDRPLALAAGHEPLLEAIGAGIEERKVAQALPSARTPRRVGCACGVDDLRVLQVLWTLRLLGAVEDAPVEPEEAGGEAVAGPELAAALESLEATLTEAVEDDAADVPVAPVWDLPPAAEERAALGTLAAAVSARPFAAAELDTPARFAAPAQFAMPGQSDVPAACAMPAEAGDPAEPVPADSAVLVVESRPSVEPAPTVGSPPQAEPRPTAADPQALGAEREWEAPRDLSAVVERFNAMHRVIFRALKAEIGAGAGNFVRSCCALLDADVVSVLEGVALHPDGGWDVDGLERTVRTRRIADPWIAYQQILEGIYERVRPCLGPARAEELKTRILALAPPASAASEGQSDSR